MAMTALGWHLAILFLSDCDFDFFSSPLRLWLLDGPSCLAHPPPIGLVACYSLACDPDAFLIRLLCVVVFFFFVQKTLNNVKVSEQNAPGDR